VGSTMVRGQATLGPFIFIGILAGIAPVLWGGVPDDPDPELQVWTFVGRVVGGAFIGAIAGAVPSLVLMCLLNSRNSPAARLRRYHSDGDS
jgi:hypothetical protein